MVKGNNAKRAQCTEPFSFALCSAPLLLSVAEACPFLLRSRLEFANFNVPEPYRITMILEADISLF